jgi:uracil permease
VVGIGGAEVQVGPVNIHAMSLATYIGILLNLVLPRHMGEEDAKASA